MNKNIDNILQQEIANIFMESLTHCGVVKLDKVGIERFNHFMNAVAKEELYEH